MKRQVGIETGLQGELLIERGRTRIVIKEIWPIMICGGAQRRGATKAAFQGKTTVQKSRETGSGGERSDARDGQQDRELEPSAQLRSVDCGGWGAYRPGELEVRP